MLQVRIEGAVGEAGSSQSNKNDGVFYGLRQAALSLFALLIVGLQGCEAGGLRGSEAGLVAVQKLPRLRGGQNS